MWPNNYYSRVSQYEFQAIFFERESHLVLIKLIAFVPKDALYLSHAGLVTGDLVFLSKL